MAGPLTVRGMASMDEVLTLIQQTQGVDEYGDPVPSETFRVVLCREESIGQAEFYQAHANGLKAEIKLVIADYLDYQGEQLLRYTPLGHTEEQLFRVLRTYRKGMELEITAYREVNPA